jgi:hypothetical protein
MGVESGCGWIFFFLQLEIEIAKMRKNEILRTLIMTVIF